MTVQSVIELGRKIRERATKPVKMPLRKLVVVHPSQGFLDDVQGAGPHACCSSCAAKTASPTQLRGQGLKV